MNEPDWKWNLRIIVYTAAAWMTGGTVHQFEGRSANGTWTKGLCILSRDALVAYRLAERVDATVYNDTDLRVPEVRG